MEDDGRQTFGSNRPVDRTPNTILRLSRLAIFPSSLLPRGPCPDLVLVFCPLPLAPRPLSLVLCPLSFVLVARRPSPVARRSSSIPTEQWRDPVRDRTGDRKGPNWSYRFIHGAKCVVLYCTYYIVRAETDTELDWCTGRLGEQLLSPPPAKRFGVTRLRLVGERLSIYCLFCNQQQTSTQGAQELQVRVEQRIAIPPIGHHRTPSHRIASPSVGIFIIYYFLFIFIFIFIFYRLFFIFYSFVSLFAFRYDSMNGVRTECTGTVLGGTALDGDLFCLFLSRTKFEGHAAHRAQGNASSQRSSSSALPLAPALSRTGSRSRLRNVPCDRDVHTCSCSCSCSESS